MCVFMKEKQAETQCRDLERRCYSRNFLTGFVGLFRPKASTLFEEEFIRKFVVVLCTVCVCLRTRKGISSPTTPRSIELRYPSASKHKRHVHVHDHSCTTDHAPRECRSRVDRALTLASVVALVLSDGLPLALPHRVARAFSHGLQSG